MMWEERWEYEAFVNEALLEWQQVGCPVLPLSLTCFLYCQSATLLMPAAVAATPPLRSVTLIRCRAT